jgi:hypothetical protein
MYPTRHAESSYGISRGRDRSSTSPSGCNTRLSRPIPAR